MTSDAVTVRDASAVSAVLDQVYAAWAAGGADAFVAPYAEQATAVLPGAYLRDRAAIRAAVAGLGSPGDWRMVPVAANGQPAAAAYFRGADGGYQAYGIVVLTVTPTGIARILVFADPGLLARFGLPPAQR